MVEIELEIAPPITPENATLPLEMAVGSKYEFTIQKEMKDACIAVLEFQPHYLCGTPREIEQDTVNVLIKLVRNFKTAGHQVVRNHDFEQSTSSIV